MKNEETMLAIEKISEVAPEAAAVLLQMRGIDQRKTEYITAPCIVPVGSTLPGKLPALVRRQRVRQVIKEFEDNLEPEFSTLAEVALYLSCLSIVYPLSSDWADVFFYTFQETYKDEFAEPWKAIGLKTPIELTDWQKENFLKKLQRDIRKKVEEALNERSKTYKIKVA